MRFHDEARDERLARVGVGDFDDELAARGDVELELPWRAGREAHGQAGVHRFERGDPLHGRDGRVDREAPVRIDDGAKHRMAFFVEAEHVRALGRARDLSRDACDLHA